MTLEDREQVRQDVALLWREARRLEKKLKGLQELKNPGPLEVQRIRRLELYIMALDHLRYDKYYTR